MADALQKEMKDSITVEATTILVVRADGLEFKEQLSWSVPIAHGTALKFAYEVS